MNARELADWCDAEADFEDDGSRDQMNRRRIAVLLRAGASMHVALSIGAMVRLSGDRADAFRTAAAEAMAAWERAA